jgi:hypothetical protein
MSLNSIQNNMDRRAAEMAQMAQHAKNPQEIQAIQQHLIAGVQNGSIKSYIGIPLIQELTQKLSAAKASTAMGAMGGQPQQGGVPIAQQVMQQAEQEGQGVEALPSGLPQEYAGGGIIAFADGGMSSEDDEEGIDFNTKDDDAEDAQIMAMFAPKRRTAGLESLMAIPAGRYEAEKVSPSGNKYEALTVEKNESGGGADERLLKHILHKESRGQRYDKEGNLLTSNKGAMGEMQVMPGTSRDPGFGITPARGNNPDELRRVGDEYARAMLSRYQDPKLAAIAYNWGPGNTDKWLSAGADMSKLPKETRGYIQGLAGGGAVRFQNRGIVDLGEDDFTTIPGMYQGNDYERALRRAKGMQDEETKPRYIPGQTLPGFTERMTTPEPMGIEGLQPSTLYADAMRAAKGNPSPPTNKLTFGETLRGMFTPETSDGTTRSVDTPTTPRGPSQTVLPQSYKVNGPSADANTMKNIDIVGRQLDEARSDFLKMKPPGQRQIQADPSLGEKYEAARARMNALQQGYENMMADTGMNQAAFGVYRGALGTAKPQANPMVQAMGAQQPVGTPQYPGAPQVNTSGPAQNTQATPGLSSPDQRTAFRGQLNKAEQGIQDRVAAQEAQAAAQAAAAAQGQSQAAPAAAQPDSVSELTDILKQQRAGISKQRDIDNYMALLSAGLGIAGGTSKNALSNIGAGAQQGINYMLQAGKTRSADERNLLSGHLGLEKAKMYAAAQQTGRDDRDRARLMDNLSGFEKNARGQAISLIGQDKLGAMEPAAQQAAVDRMVAKILSESKPYQVQMKRLMGEDYSVPQTPVAGNNVRSWSSISGK